MAPIITAKVISQMRLAGMMVSPIITAARPITIVPIPMEISAPPCVCTNSAPANAIRPLEIAIPMMVIHEVLMPCACAMRKLEPVARMDRPVSVL